MTPEKSNFAGNIHGGYLLQMLDKVAYACAARYSGHYVVTLSVDQVYFKQPIHVGELVTCLANINFVGRSSMEVGIKVIAENLETAEVRHTNSCYFTMVALDKNHKPASVKPLVMRNALDRRRNEEAIMRKEIALKVAQEHLKRKQALKAQFSG
ncbi:MAG: acyl-CoA thioesterase [Gammaproteobacteria bacterium RIFCSPHIGHO2_12_FULL_36_30]|nr:MAG: acyl-CoA thioesterase [Gammaproteobacteria bacterium RIFCSPHIGHO2_12_FULL_36_30]